jgi:hypothetical protein
MDNNNLPPNNDSNSDEIKIEMEKRKVYEATPEGSIGLLALGAVGIRLWRKAKRKAKRDSMNNVSPEINKKVEGEE